MYFQAFNGPFSLLMRFSIYLAESLLNSSQLLPNPLYLVVIFSLRERLHKDYFYHVSIQISMNVVEFLIAQKCRFFFSD